MPILMKRLWVSGSVEPQLKLKSETLPSLYFTLSTAAKLSTSSIKGHHKITTIAHQQIKYTG
jgi:hypothetical protein